MEIGQGNLQNRDDGVIGSAESTRNHPFWFLDSLDEEEDEEHSVNTEEKQTPHSSVTSVNNNDPTSDKSLENNKKEDEERDLLYSQRINSYNCYPKSEELKRNRQYLLDNPITKEKAKEIFDALEAASKTLCPASRRNWSTDETNLLFFVVANYAKRQKKPAESLVRKDWEGISKLIPGRSTDQCEYKWRCIREPKRRRADWTTEEDELLKTIVHKCSTFNWKEITNEFNRMVPSLNNRTCKQCRERWFNKLDSQIDNSLWKFEEDFAIIEGVCTYGKRWAVIRKKMPGRTEIAIRNRYYVILQNQQRETQRHDPQSAGEVAFESALEDISEDKKEAEEKELRNSIFLSMKKKRRCIPEHDQDTEIQAQNSKKPWIVCSIAPITKKSSPQPSNITGATASIALKKRTRSSHDQIPEQPNGQDDISYAFNYQQFSAFYN